MDYLGLDDEAFIRKNVPMTKQEIRILSLVKARIKPDAVIYDIGAGTGSLSIEAARMAPQGTVYALERNPEGVNETTETCLARITQKYPDHSYGSHGTAGWDNDRWQESYKHLLNAWAKEER